MAGYKNDKGAKVGISNEQIAPAGIILDAEVTLSTPDWLWLSTGIRALDHAVGTSYIVVIHSQLLKSTQRICIGL